MTHPFEDDEVLARELAEALRATRDLSDVIAARAKAAFTWRTIDHDLLTAELMFDSARDEEAAAMRADPEGEGRVLVFSAQLRSVEVEVLSDRVVGEFIPPLSGTVQVEHEGAVTASVPVDDLGFFVLEPPPEGVIRLRCATETTKLVTDWFRL